MADFEKKVIFESEEDLDVVIHMANELLAYLAGRKTEDSLNALIVTLMTVVGYAEYPVEELIEKVKTIGPLQGEVPTPH